VRGGNDCKGGDNHIYKENSIKRTVGKKGCYGFLGFSETNFPVGDGVSYEERVFPERGGVGNKEADTVAGRTVKSVYGDHREGEHDPTIRPQKKGEEGGTSETGKGSPRTRDHGKAPLKTKKSVFAGNNRKKLLPPPNIIGYTSWLTPTTLFLNQRP